MNQKTDSLAELRAAAEDALKLILWLLDKYEQEEEPSKSTIAGLRAALDALPADAVLVSREEWEAKACPWCKMLVGKILERLREQVRDEIRAGRGEGA